MLRKLYDWVMRLAASRQAPAWLGVIAFAESSFFPIPPDVMLAPMVAARPNRAFVFASICTLGSVSGAFLGYAIGYFLTGFGEQIFKFFGHGGEMAAYGQWFAHNGFWVIVGKGLTPIPFKLVTIAAGFAKFDLLQFFLACAITRAGRFFIVAALIKKFGPAILPVVEKRLTLFFILFVVLLVGGFLVLKVLH